MLDSDNDKVKDLPGWNGFVRRCSRLADKEDFMGHYTLACAIATLGGTEQETAIRRHGMNLVRNISSYKDL